jgi:chorismate mutase
LTYEEEITPIRNEINRLNEEILEKLVERVGVAKVIAEIKRRHGKPIVDKTRERAIQAKVRTYALAHKLDPDGVERIFRAIIELCVEAEEKK